MTINNLKNKISIPLGVWTPTAEVLCYACHGNVFFNNKYNEEINKFENTVISNSELEKMNTPVPPEEGKDITKCNKCGKTIQVYEAVANENNLMHELLEHNIKSHLVQTGGGCSALQISLNNDNYVWITCDTCGNNDWVLCFYNKDGEYLNECFVTFDKNELLNYISKIDNLK